MIPASFNDGLLLVHAATTLFMVGVIWFVQVVHYPLFERVGEVGFGAFERQHTRRTGWVVAMPMLGELATASALAWRLGGVLVWSGLVLLLVIWLCTWLWQVPVVGWSTASMPPRIAGWCEQTGCEPSPGPPGESSRSRCLWCRAELPPSPSFAFQAGTNIFSQP